MNTINIKALSEQVARIDGRVGSIPVDKIPKDYSETEQNTGVKWINGKDIYRKVLTGDFPEITSTQNVTVNTETGLNIINLVYLAKIGSFTYYSNNMVRYNSGTGALVINNVATSLNLASYEITIFYTKPDPVPGNREPDEEPETKKANRKKSTK